MNETVISSAFKDLQNRYTSYHIDHYQSDIEVREPTLKKSNKSKLSSFLTQQGVITINEHKTVNASINSNMGTEVFENLTSMAIHEFDHLVIELIECSKELYKFLTKNEINTINVLKLNVQENHGNIND